MGLQVKVNIGQGMMGSVFYFVRWLYYDDFFPSLVFIVAWFCISVWFCLVFFALWCGFASLFQIRRLGCYGAVPPTFLAKTEYFFLQSCVFAEIEL